jgi:hypothetical protein
MVAAAAAQAGPEELKRVASLFEKLPSPVLWHCLQFANISSVGQSMGVRSIRKAAGGLEPPSHVMVHEARLSFVELEALPGDCTVDSPQTMNYVCWWRRNVRELDATKHDWIVRFISKKCTPMDTSFLARISPDVVLFPNLTTLKLQLQGNMSFLDVPTYQSIMHHCPRLVRIKLWRANYKDFSMDMKATWMIERKQPFRAFVVAFPVQPEVYLWLANPEMEVLKFYATRERWLQTRFWTLDEVRQLCAKWGDKGNTLTELRLGSNTSPKDMDEIALLFMKHFPELKSPPWPFTGGIMTQVSGDTIRAAYGSWSFGKTLPPDWVAMVPGTSKPIDKFRTPLETITIDEKDSFFNGWNFGDVATALRQPSALRSLIITKQFGNEKVDHKLLSTIARQNPQLTRLQIEPCAPDITDECLLQIVESCPQLIWLLLGKAGDTGVFESKLQPKTIFEVTRAILSVELWFGVLCEFHADDGMALHALTSREQHSISLFVEPRVAAAMMQTADAGMWNGPVEVSYHAAHPISLRVQLKSPSPPPPPFSIRFSNALPAP